MTNVTLSFDNGPDPETTHAVLDVLEHHGVLSTFFVIGQKLDAGIEARSAVERAHKAGHWIGNHSYTHATPLGELAAPAARAEIIRTQASLGALAHPDKLFRPFGGGGKLGPHLLNDTVVEVLCEQHFTCVTWNAIPRDWDDPAGWPVRAKALCRQHPWPVVVLHDIAGACLVGLNGFLTWLKDNEYAIRQDFPDECLPIQGGQGDPVLLAPYMPAA